MDWSWWYAQIRQESERLIAEHGRDALEECIYCGRLFVKNGREQCPTCDRLDAEMRAEQLAAGGS